MSSYISVGVICDGLYQRQGHFSHFRAKILTYTALQCLFQEEMSAPALVKY